jgi:hypothetical protein
VDFLRKQGKAILIGSALTAAVVSAGAVIDAQDTPRFFIGYDDCLVLEEHQEVTVGTTLMTLADRQALRSVVVASVQAANRSAPRPTRGRNADCDSLFRDYSAVEPDKSPANVSAFGRVSELPSDFAVYFAFAGSDAIVIGGVPVALGPAARSQLVDIVRPMLPASWLRDRMLVHAYRYARARGHQAVELYVGLPVLNAPGSSPPIARISIQRHFLIDDRPAGFDAYERVSGQEERAETEPPELTYDNWSRSDTERTVAFVSGDNAGSWERLSTNVGFEGVHWIAQALRPGTPVIFHRFLYTTH